MIPAIWTGMYVEHPLSCALEVLGSHGWTAFEVSFEHIVEIEQSEDPKKLIDDALQVARVNRLSMPQAHALLQADVAAMDREARATDMKRLKHHIEIASNLGVGTVVIHPGGRAYRGETREDREIVRRLNVESFRELSDTAGELGSVIGLENLMRRGTDTGSQMLDLIDAIDRDNVKITLDTSHANAMKVDIPEMIGELGSALVATHISDNDGSVDQHKTPGSRSIQWRPVVSALKAIGYDNLFNLEIPGERDEDTELRALNSRHACNVANWLTGLDG